MNPQTIATANVIGGEKTAQTVSYPLTGDRELDFISGVLAIGQQSNLSLPQTICCLKYLLARAERQVIQEPLYQPVPNPGSSGIGHGTSGGPTFAPTPKDFNDLISKWEKWDKERSGQQQPHTFINPPACAP